MSKIALTPPRNQLLATNGNHNRIADHDGIRAAALKDFAGKKLSGPAIGKKYSINPSLIYDWSKKPATYEPLGFSEESFSHRRMAKRVKKESPKKKAAPSQSSPRALNQHFGPVKFCPNCACDIYAVAIAMKMSS